MRGIFIVIINSCQKFIEKTLALLYSIIKEERCVKMEQKPSEPIKPVMKRTVKDSIFGDLFGDVRYLIKLYRALHPEDTETTEDDISDVTIKNVLTNGQYNDLAFRIKDRVLLLLEAQSLWSSNIIIRILMYLMQTYNEYCTVNGLDLYSSTKVKLPRPELYVIFTGDRKTHPEYITLKDEFFDGQDISVDATVRVIYNGEPGDIISQYVTFTKVCNDQMKKYGRTKKAVEETIRICIDENVLADYLKEREVEVMDIMTTLFDEEEVMRRYINNTVTTTRKEEDEAIARNLIKIGKMTYEEIAQSTGLSVEDVKKLDSLQTV